MRTFIHMMFGNATLRAIVPNKWMFLFVVIGVNSNALASGNCTTLETSLQSVICGDGKLRLEADQLNTIYKRLETSTAKDVAFLARSDITAFVISLNDCRNAPSISELDLSPQGCVAKRLEEKLNTISQASDAVDLVRELRKEKFLSLSLLPTYGTKFVGVAASWFGELRLTEKLGGSLEGIFSNTPPTYHFRAFLKHPNSLDTTFFTAGECRYGCTSWWKGEFILQNKALVFQLTSHQT